MDGSNFCLQHQDISPAEHKDRWFSKFILGRDGDPFLFQYDTHKQDRILGDLRDKIIVLTEEDIKENLPPRRKYIDIYLLLVENGYAKYDSNLGMYYKCIEYLSDFWIPNRAPLNMLAVKICENLILKDTEQLDWFLYSLTVLLKKQPFAQSIDQRLPAIEAFLFFLLQSDTAEKLSWIPFRDRLVKHYEVQLGMDHPVTDFLQRLYLPRFNTIYQEQKKLQKEKMDQCKEELMAYCWHPDRFLTWCLDEEEKAENRELFG